MTTSAGDRLDEVLRNASVSTEHALAIRALLDERDRLRALLSAAGGPVPREPTPEMLVAGFLVSEAEHDPGGVWRAMYDAAPAREPEGAARQVTAQEREILREALKRTAAQREPEGERVPREEPMADAAEMLWVVLANVSGGDWTKQSSEWQKAAARWRDNYFIAAGIRTPPADDVKPEPPCERCGAEPSEELCQDHWPETDDGRTIHCPANKR